MATRTLEPGEQILIELPVVIGPKPDSYVMCLGCYARLDGSKLCSRCRWPVCGPECEAAPCHAKAECPVFESARVRFQSMENYMDACPQLNCIAPLRLLLAKESNPERWESEVKFMETHNEERRQTPLWENNQINVVEYLRSACKLAARYDIKNCFTFSLVSQQTTHTKNSHICVISGFRCEIDEICALPGHYERILVLPYRRSGTTYR